VEHGSSACKPCWASLAAPMHDIAHGSIFPYTSQVLGPLRRTLATEGSVTFSVRARPHAPRTAVKDVMDDGSVKIAVAAPAEEGKANEELVRFLAEEFGVHSSQVEILSGGGNRRKMVRITK